MKTNIVRCDYLGNKKNNGKWWKYKGTCDRCGSVIEDFDMLHSQEPDQSEADFCLRCLRYLMDSEISYTDAKHLYKR